MRRLYRRLLDGFVSWLSAADAELLLWIVRNGTLKRPKPTEPAEQMPTEAKRRFYELVKELEKKAGNDGR